MGDNVSVTIPGPQRGGSGVAELWCGSALLGMLHEEGGGIVLRLESRARGPLAVDAVALERALAEARETLAAATGTGESGRVPMANGGSPRPPAPTASLRRRGPGQ